MEFPTNAQFSRETLQVLDRAIKTSQANKGKPEPVRLPQDVKTLQALALTMGWNTAEATAENPDYTPCNPRFCLRGWGTDDPDTVTRWSILVENPED